MNGKKWAKYGLLAFVGVVAVVATIAVISSAGTPQVGLSQMLEEELHFKNWMTENSKQYKDEKEYFHRLSVFRDNLAFIRIHNTQGHSYELGMNQFGDMTPSEFAASMLSSSVPETRDQNVQEFDENIEDLEISAAVDWRSKNAVTPVKNQGACGSCWAFSAVGAIEGISSIKTNTLTSLSEQQLIDCSNDFGNKGCNGGWMTQAYNYVIKSGGIESTYSYPYEALENSYCYALKSYYAAKITGYYYVRPTTASLLAAVAQQPVSVAVNASNWQFYKSGIYSDNSCSTSVNHGVLIVGYNTLSTTDYWIVKNSWGTGWGQGGYIFMNRNSSSSAGLCGINQYASFPSK